MRGAVSDGRPYRDTFDCAAWYEAVSDSIMKNLILPEKKAVDTGLLELGFALGQSHTFGLVAGRCSAAHAQAIRHVREEKLFKQCCERWEGFCPSYLNLSRAEADRIVRLLDEFGPY